ncbi:MAG: hypothetical protein ABIQ12_06100 [Opitutaceae bacterium]
MPAIDKKIDGLKRIELRIPASTLEGGEGLIRVRSAFLTPLHARFFRAGRITAKNRHNEHDYYLPGGVAPTGEFGARFREPAGFSAPSRTP